MIITVMLMKVIIRDFMITRSLCHRPFEMSMLLGITI